jgi:DinB superfamily
MNWHNIASDTKQGCVMHDLLGRSIADRINRTHDDLLKLCDPLSEAEIALRPSQAAPPIGWHLWHIARWADHFQASFPEGVQIWQRADYPVQWILDTTLLGPMESGIGMPVFIATELVAKVGKVRLLDYARLVFVACGEALRGLETEQLQSKRQSFARWTLLGTQVVDAPGVDTTLLEDCLRHVAHANRHLGMIEALIGASLTRKGSATY